MLKEAGQMSLIPGKLAKDPYTVFRNRDPARLFTKNFTSDDISVDAVPYLSGKSLLSCEQEVFQYQ